MQIHNLLTLTSIALSLATLAVEAFVPPQQRMFSDLASSFEDVAKRASDAVSLKSSRAEPISANNNNVVNPDPKVKEAVTKLKSTAAVATRHAVEHKRWGIDNTNEDEYWYDSRIHTLGNDGFFGALHAALAPISTKMIDRIAYQGVDIRGKVAEELATKIRKQKARVIDLCCGVGFSTRALTNAFPNAEQIVGVDTSNEMLAMARFISAHVGHLRPAWNQLTSQNNRLTFGAQNIYCPTSFTKGNAESTPFKDGSFDVVTIMYAFHEAPQKGRQRILEEARRLLSPGGVLAVIDISTEYTPSKSMLAGEPYVIEYQKNIQKQLGNQRGFARAQRRTLVPGHVDMWVLKRSNAYA